MGISKTCSYALSILCLTVYRLELGCGSLLLIIDVSFSAIFMSVNVAKLPYSEKELLTLINVCLLSNLSI